MPYQSLAVLPALLLATLATAQPHRSDPAIEPMHPPCRQQQPHRTPLVALQLGQQLRQEVEQTLQDTDRKHFCLDEATHRRHHAIEQENRRRLLLILSPQQVEQILRQRPRPVRPEGDRAQGPAAIGKMPNGCGLW